jgi:hypothetical protein
LCAIIEDSKQGWSISFSGVLILTSF